MELTQEIKDLLVKHYYDNDVKRQKETAKLFETKSYDKLKHGTSFLRRESCEHIIDCGRDQPSLDEVIDYLTEFKESRTELMEGEYHVNICNCCGEGGYGNDYTIVISFTKYHLTEVQPITEKSYLLKLREIAHKMEYQPNGKDTQIYLALIERLKNNIK